MLKINELCDMMYKSAHVYLVIKIKCLILWNIIFTKF